MKPPTYSVLWVLDFETKGNPMKTLLLLTTIMLSACLHNADAAPINYAIDGLYCWHCVNGDWKLSVCPINVQSILLHGKQSLLFPPHKDIMKVIELRERLDKLDPTLEIVFGQEAEPNHLSIKFHTNLRRVEEHVNWLNNRQEDLSIVPAIGATFKIKSNKDLHKYGWDHYFDLQVVSHRYEYLPGYGQWPGKWEVVVELSYPSTFQSITSWNEYMDGKGY